MMTDVTLLVSRARKLYPDFMNFLNELGFKNLSVTDLDHDALFFHIRDLNPKLLVIDSNFHQAATPCFVGELSENFPKLNIVAIAYNDYPLYLASWFIWHGAKSCLHLWADGLDEFKHGFREINMGHDYISPAIQEVMNLFPEWPQTKNHITKRQYECLVLLCNGFTADSIASELNLSRKTIDCTLGAMFDIFHVHSKEALMSHAWASGLVSKQDLRFYQKDKDLKIPEWAKAAMLTNKKLEDFYHLIHGGDEINVTAIRGGKDA
jgi:DNA-binding NarL/FixJ family response regulator